MNACNVCGQPASDEICHGCLMDWFICEEARILIADASLTDEERLRRLNLLAGS